MTPERKEHFARRVATNIRAGDVRGAMVAVQDFALEKERRDIDRRLEELRRVLMGSEFDGPINEHDAGGEA